MAAIKVSQEKCKKCIYGYPCEMWDELSLPLEGERCDNYEDVTKLGTTKSYTDLEESKNLIISNE